MSSSRNLVPVIGTVLLVSVTALAALGISRGMNASPPMPVAGQAILGMCALAGVAGLIGVWLPRLRGVR